jgi:TetR/AcrR family transcriptional regulator, regulator of autoinduction and epiphytic fitness
LDGRVATTTDGRVQRGERNRQALVDALLALYRSGVLEPTAQQIAAEAGVAPRSVYHHFADLEALAAELSARQLRDHRDLFETPVLTGDLSARVDEIVTRRSALFEAITPVRRAALLHVHRSDTIRNNLATVATHLRAQLADTFAGELTDRPELLDPLDLLASWEAWERLRTQQRLSGARARTALRTTMLTLLTGGTRP